jgi:hypothetical protein
MRSHRPKTVGRWESADHYQDSIQGYVSRLLGQVPTQFSCGFNYPSLLDEGQGAIHACATVQWTPDRAGMSTSTRRSHDRTRVCNTTYIDAQQHTQPAMDGLDAVFGQSIIRRLNR